MKRQHIQLIVIVAIGFFLVNILKPNQWDIIVYSLLTLVLLLTSGQEIYRIIKTRKGIYVEGCVSQEESAGENNEIKKVIEFISPTDNKEYKIKDVNNENCKIITQSPSKVKVWVNIKNPQKSLIAKEFDGMVFLSLSGKMLMAIFFLIMVIISW